MNELIPAGPESLPDIARDDHPVWALVGDLGKTIEKEMGVDTIARLPTKKERPQIEEYVRRMRVAARPASESMAAKDEAARAIAAMLGRYPSLRNADVPGMISAYLLDLQDFPAFAIVEVCLDVRKGRVKGLDPDWPPASPRLVALCDQKAAPVRAKMLTAQRVLAVTKVRRVVTDAQREVVSAKLKGMATNWRVEAENRRAEVVERVDRETTRPANDMLLRREWLYDGGEPPTSMGLAGKGAEKPVIIASPELARSNREYAAKMKIVTPRRTEGT